MKHLLEASTSETQPSRTAQYLGDQLQSLLSECEQALVAYLEAFENPLANDVLSFSEKLSASLDRLGQLLKPGLENSSASANKNLVSIIQPEYQERILQLGNSLRTALTLTNQKSASVDLRLNFLMQALGHTGHLAAGYNTLGQAVHAYAK